MISTLLNPSSTHSVTDPTLGLTFSELKSIVGRYLQYGSTEANWDTEQAADVDLCIKGGLRKFYIAYNWRFLRTTITLTTVANQSAYDLPSNIAGILGMITFDQSVGYAPIPIGDEEMIRERDTWTSGVGIPNIAAIRYKAPQGTHEQRQELLLWPPPDGAFNFQFRCVLVPSMPTTAMPYFLGGAQHAETIVAACLAVAEERFADTQDVKRAAFSECLAASIQREAAVGGPQIFGIMTDPGMDYGDTDRVMRVRGLGSITVNT